MLDKLRDQLDSASAQLGSIAFGLAEMVVVFVVAWLVARRLRGPLRRRLAGAPLSASGKVLVENTAALAVYVIAFTLLLGLWGATWSAVLTALSAGTIAIVLGLQDILKSIVAGIFILFERPFGVGDQVKVRDVEGRVESIGLRATTIRTDTGELVTAPNGLIFTDPVSNRSPYRTLRTTVTVAGVRGDAAELKSAVAAALVETQGLEAAPEIVVRSHRAKVKAPRRLPGAEMVNRGAGVLVKPPVATGTQIRVEWIGSGQPSVRDEVVRRLKERFPDAQVRVQRH